MSLCCITPTSIWKPDWGGETIFYKDDHDAVLAVTPRAGRLVISRSAILHRGSVPTHDCHEARLTIAYKLRSGRAAFLGHIENVFRPLLFELKAFRDLRSMPDVLRARLGEGPEEAPRAAGQKRRLAVGRAAIVLVRQNGSPSTARI